MKKPLLLVPIHLDALHLTSAQQVIGAKSDFSRLPYFDNLKKLDINTDIANISENFLSKPFQSQNLTLEAGMHLHWALPDALTRGIQGKDNYGEIKYPLVPDRWLVTRKNNGNIKQWIVESNFLQKEEQDNTEQGITFPLNTPDRGPAGQPYRFMGRQYDYDGSFKSPGENYFGNLTAIGYGDPTFGAFYPECHSIFGCFDPSPPDNGVSGSIEYEVIGWYNIPANDHLSQFVQSKEYKGFEKNDRSAAINKAIKEACNFSYEESGSYPQNLVCYGRLKFVDNVLKNFPDTLPEVEQISIGNTGTEALSAMLSGGEDKKTEKQLEAIRLMSKVGNRRLDINAKFEEAFHDNGFTPVKGGSIWIVGVDTEACNPIEKKAGSHKDTGSVATENKTKSPVEVSLPEVFAYKLNILNKVQQKFDRALDEYRDLQRQLFSDWYKYMAADYHPYIKHEEIGDIDEIKFFIETRNFKGLEKKSKELETLSPHEDHKGTAWQAKEDVKEEIRKCNEGEIPKEKQLFISDSQALSYKFIKDHYLEAEEIDKYPGLTIASPLEWGRCEQFNTDCLNFKGGQSKISISLNKLPDPLPEGKNELSKLLSELKLIKALSMWVKISASSGSGGFNLVNIDGYDNSAIGPSQMGEFWKGIYINGRKMDPYTTHKWQEIPKDEWIHLYLEATDAFDEPLILMENCPDNDVAVGMANLRIMKRGLSEDELFCDRNIFKQTQYILSEGAAPRYWQPNEPVVLLSGPACEPSARHGFDGHTNEDKKLGCFIIRGLDYPLNNTGLDALVKREPLQTFYNNEMNDYLNWTKQPWNPIILEWEVEISPLTRPEGSYEGNSITKAFQLNDATLDLTISKSEPMPEYEKSGKIYSGSTLISPHAKIKLLDALNGFIGNMKDQQPTDWMKNPAVTFAHTKLDQVNLAHFLSQSFGGFNSALLMHKQTLQLPIEDPLGFPEYQVFTRAVQGLVGRENKWAPEPLNPFLPIRAGKLKVLNLRLIDSFGRFMNIKPGENLIHSHAFPDMGGEALLLPRLTQPARLNLRWLSANHDDLEMNSHPASSPICGWLLPNNLDNSLMVYDQDGDLFGLVDQKGGWRPGPGNKVKVEIDQVPNKHLRQVIRNLEKDPSKFIGLLDNTLEKIDPESFAQHLDLALLMGRPIAVVRASISLEVKGLSAVSQSWELFTKDIGEGDHDTEGFENVRFPVRLGEPGQFNDGVIGFWKDGAENGVFQSALSGGGPEKKPNHVHYYDPGIPNITASIAEDPQTFTILMDPRAKVHLVSGILPTKIIDIPPDQYSKALSAINISFLTSPVLSPAGTIALPLPNEPGYEWSWLSMLGDKWGEVSKTGRLDKHKVLDAFPNGEQIWQNLLASYWIDPVDGFSARIVLKNKRKNKSLSEAIAPDTDRIEQLLDQCMINSPDLAASFTGSSEIHEGWLKLSPTKKGKKV